jgi:hypothetical protein
MSTHTITIAPDEIVEVERVGGDLLAEGWDGADIQAVGDQVRIEKRSGTVAISCGGDLKLSLPRAAHLSAGAIGGAVRLQDLSGKVELGLVGGDAVLLNLSGPVQLNGMVGGDTHMENVSNISLRPGSPTPGFDLNDRVRRKVEQATQRAEEKVRRAEDKIRRAETKARNRPHVLFGWDPAARAGAEPAGEPVSDEERMAILRMLQEKKITSEEADKLLAALEGNG